MTIIRVARNLITHGNAILLRVLSDAVEVGDNNIASIIRGRLLQDGATISDLATASYIPGGGGTIVFEDTFASGIDSAWTNNTSGNSFATHHSESGGFVRIAYTTEGDHGLNFTLIERDKREIYIKLESRQNDDITLGPKHLKIFGQSGGGGVSNCTFQILSYATNYGLTYGDSNSSSNDNSIEWDFNGSDSGGGTTYTRAEPTLVTAEGPILQDTAWHRWDYHIKFNDNGVQNGFYIVRYEGVEVFRLENVWNRADAHGAIDSFGIGQYMNISIVGESFTRDYRNVAIAYDGWIA